MDGSPSPFDEYAPLYDGWFLANDKVLMSEVRLLRYFLSRRPIGRALSVGCGSGLFERILREQFGTSIEEGVEPSAMGEIAVQRGLKVTRARAESLPFPDGSFDTLIMNGVLDYLSDPRAALSEAHRVLRAGGWLIVADVSAEGSYGLLYSLAAVLGWDALRRVAPEYSYPLEFVRSARWRTAEEIAGLLVGAGFVGLEFAQTLTRHPKYSNAEVEDPQPGYDRGDYIAVKAEKGKA